MSLSKIKEELYKKETDAKILQHQQSEFNSIGNSVKENIAGVDLWENKQDKLSSESKKAFKIGALVLGGIILLLTLVAGFYKIKQSFFAQERVNVSISGSDSIENGKLVSYEIKYANNNRADLKNVTIKITYPDYFTPEGNSNFNAVGTTAGLFKLGLVKGNVVGSVMFSGKVYKPKGGLMKILADFSYTPTTVNSQFIANDQLPVNIVSSPITISLLAPQSISSGDEVDYVFAYKNTGTADFSNIKIKAEYPDRFIFSNANPKTSESNNVWYIGNLSAGQEGKIVVIGRLSGDKDSFALTKVSIGADSNNTFLSYDDQNMQTKIVASPLVIFQTVNGLSGLSIDAGDSLKFEINYKNEGAIGLSDLIVTEKLDSNILDESSLSIDGGSYDGSNKTITWKASDHGQLKRLNPGQSGKINFSIKVKDVIPITSLNDKNFIVSGLAKIDSPDIPTLVNGNKVIASNAVNMKLNSKLILAVSGYYNDVNIPNSGPLPPKVGNETTYTIHLSATNISNDVSDARVKIVLPTGVVATGKKYPENEPLSYDERTNDITWDLGTLSAGIGVTSSAREVSFQIKIKPSINQVGSEAVLFSQAVFSAKDSFTNENLSFTAKVKTTKLAEDGSIGDNYKVTN
jgi:hypothetical protein